ncbi:hypothetical protein N658DRAFT_222259 [Parathielavia hyrcaniae]|uniref:Uncharacterized protein n=1 Tax=Parathielavia hyrcaniae TaxID=113614 RepID=A0AAN6PUX3_9PEZI|nr:hypothetical protein N658DRAFT_222259 [Parathielavia hyrcaniae]
MTDHRFLALSAFEVTACRARYCGAKGKFLGAWRVSGPLSSHCNHPTSTRRPAAEETPLLLPWSLSRARSSSPTHCSAFHGIRFAGAFRFFHLPRALLTDTPGFPMRSRHAVIITNNKRTNDGGVFPPSSRAVWIRGGVLSSTPQIVIGGHRCPVFQDLATPNSL